MSKLTRQRSQRKRKNSPLVLFLLLLLVWSIILGWGIAVAIEPSVNYDWSFLGDSQAKLINTQQQKSLDPDIPSQYKLGREIYLENCSTCHIALPPAVLPTESWRQIMLRPDRHFRRELPPINKFDVRIMWRYMRDFSRPRKEGEYTPERVFQSRYFQALHPRVELPEVVRLSDCANCHTGIADFDYRRLTSEWEDAP